ncbi:MAG: hypothetical protein IJS69_06950 [Selenomonadaceae bacterium]|nr:hypothetical protein [Selenomonadaceae bacterium]
MTRDEKLMNQGMDCLIDNLGIVEAQRFIALVIRERSDYTQWQREYFDKMPPGAFHAAAIEYAKQNPQ